MKMVAYGAATVAALAAAPVLAARLKKMWKRHCTKLQLLYFNISGLGEPIRLTLACAGMDFDDYRFKDRDEFMARKPTLTFGQVPCLVVDESTELVQSAAIMRYIAREFDVAGTLYPSDPRTAARVDALLDQSKDMMQGWGVASYRERFGFTLEVLSDEAASRAKEIFLAEILPKHILFLEQQLASSSTGWLAGTAAPTIADLLLATIVKNTFLDKCGVTVPAATAAWVEAVYSLPAVAAFKKAEA